MNLTTQDKDSFYGMRLETIHVEGLTPRLFHGIRQGEPYTRLDLLDATGVKWQIRPTSFSLKKIPASFRLYHRNRYGPRGFHSQKELATGTRSSAVRDLLDYVARHEQYEFAGDLTVEQHATQ